MALNEIDSAMKFKADDLSGKADDLSGKDVQNLLSEHMDRMADHSPPESRYVLDVKYLQPPEITLTLRQAQ